MFIEKLHFQLLHSKLYSFIGGARRKNFKPELVWVGVGFVVAVEQLVGAEGYHPGAGSATARGV